MKKYIYEGKTIEELKEKALTELKVSEEDLMIKVIEEKNSLLKKSAKIEATTINDISNYIKELLNEDVIKLEGIAILIKINEC